MTWEILLPFRDESDPILSIDHGELATLGPGDAEVAAHILAELSFVDGIRTVRDAFDHLEAIGGDGRRRLLDRARLANGWPPTGVVDEAERQRSAPIVSIRTTTGPMRDGDGRPVQCCPECGAFPLDQHGAVVGSNARRWWCERHREGHEEDLKDREPDRIIAVAGGFMFESELQAEAERGKVQDAHMREELERRRAEAKVEAELAAEAERRHAEVMATDAFANPLLGANWSGQA